MNRKERRQIIKEKERNKQETAYLNQGNSKRSTIQRIYEDKYKQLIIIPFAILLIAILIIVMNIVQTGDFVSKGYSLSGGISITVTVSDLNIVEMSSYLKDSLPNYDIIVRQLSEAGQNRGFIVESDMEDQGKEIISLLEAKYPEIKNKPDSISVTSIGSNLGASFFKDALIALILSFVFMSAVVFIIFKKPAPSLAVILCAFSDIVVTLAVINVTGIKLSTSGIAALLMLIGYSVDSDILLSTRVLKDKKGTVMNRIYSALKTGLTMNMTTMITVLVGLFVSQSTELKQIFLILFIGLIIDIINTWIQNVGILRMYLERISLNKKNKENQKMSSSPRYKIIESDTKSENKFKQTSKSNKEEDAVFEQQKEANKIPNYKEEYVQKNEENDFPENEESKILKDVKLESDL